MKEPMTDARRKQLYRIKKRKRRKQCIRVALRMAVLCFLVLFAVQKTADLLRWMTVTGWRMQNSHTVDREERHGQIRKNMGSIRKADVLTQEDKLHSIEESDEYPDSLRNWQKK